MEKWEDRKDFNFPLFCFVGGVERGKMKKVNLYKFTQIPLLKNDVQLKQKKWQITNKKKEQSPKFIKKIKIMS